MEANAEATLARFTAGEVGQRGVTSVDAAARPR
jgi:hypothetical protein